MTAREVSNAMGAPYTNITRAFTFYQECEYVIGKQDRRIKGKPKRYRLTAKGKRKFKSLEVSRRTNPELWVKNNDKVSIL